MSFFGIESFEGGYLGGLGADLQNLSQAQKTILGLKPWLTPRDTVIQAVNDMYQQGYSLTTGQDDSAYSNWPSVFRAALRNNAAYSILPFFGETSDGDIAVIFAGMKQNNLIFTRKTSPDAQAARTALLTETVAESLYNQTLAPAGPSGKTAQQEIADANRATVVAKQQAAAKKEGPLDYINAGVSVLSQIQAEKLRRKQLEQQIIDQQIASGNIPRLPPARRRPGQIMPSQPVTQVNPVGYALLGVAALAAILLFATKK